MNTNVGVVQSVEYGEKWANPDGSGGITNIFVVTYDGPHGGIYRHELQNGAYTFHNDALAFMAFCGASPSTYEECVGESIPIVRNENTTDPEAENYYVLARSILDTGKEKLADSNWFPDAYVPNDES